MHDYLFHTDVVRLAFLAGVVASIFLYEKSHLTTGSIVVPGYIALFLAQPFVIAVTFANALLSWWIVNRLLPRWFLLYGRTKFTVLALISISMQTVLLKVSPSTRYLWESDIALLVGVGYVVPALIAHDMARQGVRKTIRAVLLAGVVVAAPIGLMLLAVGNPALRPAHIGPMAIEPGWVPVAVFLSAAVSWGLLKNRHLRAGGFIGAGYTAMLSANFLHLAFILGVGFVSYLVVTRVLMRRMILFGRRKFAAMLLVSGVVGWTMIAVGGGALGVDLTAYTTLAPIALTPLFLPGLVANDMHRGGPRGVLYGLALGGAWVLATTRVAQGVVGPRPVDLFPLGVALFTGTYIFWDDLVSLARHLGPKLGRLVVPVPVRTAAAGRGVTPGIVARNALFGVSLGIAVGAFALALHGQVANGSVELGALAARLTLVVALPLAMRLFWTRILQTDTGARVVSGWMFVHAALLALLVV
ncbi:MAG: poly-gamma-glutamate biosynthesis protein PgsC [Gaiellales bacterium]